MAELINSLDNSLGNSINKNLNNIQYGEKGHLEYGWSDNIQEKLVQFNFQLCRLYDEDRISKLQGVLSDILSSIKLKLDNGTIDEKINAVVYLRLLYKMIGYTRDIISGKGEYKLTYMLIYTWYGYFPELAKYALKCCVELDDNIIHPYGSWKDIKYFCNYILEQNLKKTYRQSNNLLIHPLIPYCIELINNRLKKDVLIIQNNERNIDILDNDDTTSYNDLSLVAKWIPREKSSKFGWLFNELAENYYSYYLDSAEDNDESYKKAILKCKTHYRKLIASINKKLDTLQIKQCSHKWSSIDFNKTTSLSLIKQKKAFLNLKKNGEVKYPNDNDRIICADNFKNFIATSIKNNKHIKGGKVSMVDFTKQALLGNITQIEIDLLNSQWKDNSLQNKALDNLIAMVDVSGSMEGDPLAAAISLGIRIAEKSKLGKRVMTFSSSPSWINLENFDDFVSQVRVIKHGNWGMNTNFYAALNLILNSIIENKMHPNDVNNMTLVILSDMQMDIGDNCDKNTLYENMKFKYQEAGLRVWGKEYEPPHILFWNLRSNNGFPCLASNKNTSMMSGFSPLLLNMFCELGPETLNNYTPYSMLVKCLENNRYKYLEDKFNEIM